MKLSVCVATIVLVSILAGSTHAATSSSEVMSARNSDAAAITQGRIANPRHAGDPRAVRALNPNFDTFPDSSLVDFSYLLDAPAGKHGWVEQGPDGHFRTEKNGERLRFWSMTVAADHVGQIEKARIATVLDVMARGGCNMVRLHEMDNRGGEKYNLVRRNIIDEAYPNNNRSTEFDAEYRDRVDYWVAQAQERGMYVYLVLRGYRTFRDGDGLTDTDKMDRAGRTYAFFNERLIELQKQYADDFLFNHVNPYTGIPNGLNPAVCMLEIENEDSLLYNHVPWRDLMEPYRTEFKTMWNDWLRQTYGDTATLRRAWTNDANVCALGNSESIEEGTVELPSMKMMPLEKAMARPWDDPDNSPVRNRDGVAFARQAQRKYFATMRDHLRARGAKMPLNAVVHGNFISDTFTPARELGSAAENAYIDHPIFVPGAQWTGKAYFQNENILKETELAEHMLGYKWAGAGLVCREWTNCWPNEYRVASFPLMAAHSSVQDFDLISHFAYYTWGNPDLLLSFAPQADPTRWGLNGYAAALFLKGALQPDAKVVRLAYNDADLNTWADYSTPLHKLGVYGRTELWNPDAPEMTSDTKDSDVLMTITSGRSGKGAYKGDNLVLFDRWFADHAKLPADQRGQTVIAASGYDHKWMWAKEGMTKDNIEKAGYTPFLLPDSSKIIGFLDPKRSNLVLGNVTEETAAEAAILRAAILRDEAKADTFTSTTAVASDGAFQRDLAAGTLRVATPTWASVAGELKPGETYAAGALQVETSSPIAAITAVSLDGKPLAEARRYAIKMATVARNRSQDLRPVPPDEKGGGKFVLAYEGVAPVQTLGVPSEAPTVVHLGGREIARVYMMNGTWEVVVDRDNKWADVMCDTSNVKIELGHAEVGRDADTSGQAPITKFFTEHPPEDSGQTGTTFVYPGFAKYVRVGAKAW
ncbi:hypothetical protein CVU37_05785 [candidate division BRC1 bacterium HGW-BRC1-1]|jgi:hypothetical protein|nr:MAG: hypothetical protein CVU37_05785 [candidate division BRC1 bacterium HGW-BRC1-1]